MFDNGVLYRVKAVRGLALGVKVYTGLLFVLDGQKQPVHYSVKQECTFSILYNVFCVKNIIMHISLRKS
jgi:hypothetical protein